MSQQEEKKKGIKGYLDTVFSEDGLKTDIKITVTNQTMLRVSAYALGTAFVITVMVFGVRSIVNQNTQVAG